MVFNGSATFKGKQIVYIHVKGIRKLEPRLQGERHGKQISLKAEFNIQPNTVK